MGQGGTVEISAYIAQAHVLVYCCLSLGHNRGCGKWSLTGFHLPRSTHGSRALDLRWCVGSTVPTRSLRCGPQAAGFRALSPISHNHLTLLLSSLTLPFSPTKKHVSPLWLQNQRENIYLQSNYLKPKSISNTHA